MPPFAEQLSAARKAAGMTQEELAVAVHVTRTTVSSWERGRTRPNLEALKLLSQVLSFDFIAGVTTTDAATNTAAEDTKAEVKLTPADTAPPQAAPTEAPESGETPAHSTARRRLPLILCAAAVLLIVCLVLFVLPLRRSGTSKRPIPDVDPALLLPEEPALFTREWFQGENIQYEGEPYLKLTTPFTVNTNSRPYPMWHFSVIIEEVTGRPFKPERLDSYFFETDVGYRHEWVKASALWAAESGNAWRTDGVNPVSGMKGVGYIIYGYDEWGRKMSFRTYLDFTKAE